LNFNYDIIDLENSNVENLLRYKQLWVVTTEFMDASTQKLLVDYVKNGGSLILYPAIPILDLYLNPCSVLKDELGVNLQNQLAQIKLMRLELMMFTLFSRKNRFFKMSAKLKSFQQQRQMKFVESERMLGMVWQQFLVMYLVIQAMIICIL
jgi:beta-galactosidase GanA